MITGALVFFDLETGGLDPRRHPVIQVAAVAVELPTWRELETFEAKVTFSEAACDAKALEVNHYDPEVWAREALSPAVVRGRLADLFKRHASIPQVSKRTGAPYSVARLAGHNAASFDLPFLRALFADAFMPAHPLVLDTLQLAMWSLGGAPGLGTAPDNYRLETLCQVLGIDLQDAHDALSDVRATVRLAHRLVGG